MAVDVWAVLCADGRAAMDLLEFRVVSVQLEPVENLPGGKLNAGQRMAVERVWRPQVRPLAGASGFGPAQPRAV